MKIRNGFVSNSSTSSFICLGWETNNLNINEKFITEFKNFLKTNNISIDEDIDENEEYTFSELLNDCNIPDTTVSTEDGNGNYFFGFELSEEMSLERLKTNIAKVEENCNDEKHVFSFYQKHFGKPKFKTIVEMNY